MSKMRNNRKLTFVIAICILAIMILPNVSTSASELIVNKMGAEPNRAEIITDDLKVYEMTGEDFDSLMIYLNSIKLRKILLSDSTAFSTLPDVRENYSLHLTSTPDNSGDYQGLTIHLNMGANGRLYLREHLGDTYQIIEPESLKGLYELLKNKESRQ